MKYITVIDKNGFTGVIALSENLTHADHLGGLKPVSAGFCNADFSNCRGESASLGQTSRTDDERILKTLMEFSL